MTLLNIQTKLTVTITQPTGGGSSGPFSLAGLEKRGQHAAFDHIRPRINTRDGVNRDRTVTGLASASSIDCSNALVGGNGLRQLLKDTWLGLDKHRPQLRLAAQPGDRIVFVHEAEVGADLKDGVLRLSGNFKLLQDAVFRVIEFTTVHHDDVFPEDAKAFK